MGSSPSPELMQRLLAPRTGPRPRITDEQGRLVDKGEQGGGTLNRGAPDSWGEFFAPNQEPPGGYSPMERLGRYLMGNRPPMPPPAGQPMPQPQPFQPQPQGPNPMQRLMQYLSRIQAPGGPQGGL